MPNFASNVFESIDIDEAKERDANEQLKLAQSDVDRVGSELYTLRQTLAALVGSGDSTPEKPEVLSAPTGDTYVQSLLSGDPKAVAAAEKSISEQVKAKQVAVLADDAMQSKLDALATAINQREAEMESAKRIRERAAQAHNKLLALRCYQERFRPAALEVCRAMHSFRHLESSGLDVGLQMNLGSFELVNPITNDICDLAGCHGA